MRLSISVVDCGWGVRNCACPASGATVDKGAHAANTAVSVTAGAQRGQRPKVFKAIVIGMPFPWCRMEHQALHSWGSCTPPLRWRSALARRAAQGGRQLFYSPRRSHTAKVATLWFMV